MCILYITMPFEVGKSINDFTNNVFKSDTIYNISRNPIYTALTITFIIVLIIMFIFRDADTEESLLVMSLRAGFWILLMLTGILFLHNKVLDREMDTNRKNDSYEYVFKDGYNGGNLEDTIIPVRINTDFT